LSKPRATAQTLLNLAVTTVQTLISLAGMEQPTVAQGPSGSCLAAPPEQVVCCRKDKNFSQKTCTLQKLSAPLTRPKQLIKTTLTQA